MKSFRDLTNQKFGMLVAKYPTHERKNGCIVWHCDCDCGGNKKVPSGELARGNVTSCGCKKTVDLTEKRFGKLVARRRSHKNKKNKWYWICDCDCGESTIVAEADLNAGKCKSCGCLKQEKFLERITTHNKSNTRLHGIWGSMKQRCYNPNANGYENYGGRGIAICDDWVNNFQEFYDWSINNGYSDELSLDRIDVNGNYEPSNCRWADEHTQANNKQSSVHITINNETYTIAEWGELVNLPTNTIGRRLRDGFQDIDIFRINYTKANNKPMKFRLANKDVCMKDNIYFLTDSLDKKYGTIVGINENEEILIRTEKNINTYSVKSIVYIYDLWKDSEVKVEVY